MSKVVVDTNVIIGFLMRGEKVFEEAFRKYDELVVPAQIVFETVYTLTGQYKKTRQDVVESVAKLLQKDRVMSDRVILLNTLYKFRDFPKLSLVDCYLVVLAGEMGCEVLTNDREMKKRVTQ